MQPRFSGHDCEFLDECSYDPCHSVDSFFVDNDGVPASPERFFCVASEIVSSFDGQSFERFLCVDPDKTVTGDFYCRCPTCMETIFDNSTVASLATYLTAHPSMALHIKGELRKQLSSNGECVDPAVPRTGCMTSTSLNFDSLANVDSGDCIPTNPGCMNANATNYESWATYEDGSCEMRWPNGTFMVDVDECVADPCNKVVHFNTTAASPVCEESWQCIDANTHMLNDYTCTCPQSICGLEAVVPDIMNFNLSIYLHSENVLKVHLLEQTAQPTTTNGCTCMAAWNTSALGCADGMTYNGCGMMNPCNGDDGGVAGQSWCQVVDASSCNAAGAFWDYCVP